MFTLGNKEAVVNSSSKFKTEIKTIGGFDNLHIEGFGTFGENQVLDVVAQRYIAPNNAMLEITAPFATDLGIDANAINVPVVVHIIVNTTRHTSEWATDFIKRGRPFIFEILVNGGESDADIAGKLAAAFANTEAVFNISPGLPFSWTVTGEVITLTLKSHFLSFKNYVEFFTDGSVYGTQASTNNFFDSGASYIVSSAGVTTLSVSDTSSINVGDVLGIVVTVVTETLCTVTGIIDATTLTVTPTLHNTTAIAVLVKSLATEPTFDGAYLEANVRASMQDTTDTYGIGFDEVPVIKGEYTTVTWTTTEEYSTAAELLWRKHAFLGKTRGDIGGNRMFMYTMYFLEDTDLFTDLTGKVWTLLDHLITTVNGTTKLILANGSFVLTASDFVNA